MNYDISEIELLEPIPKEHIYATIPVSSITRPHYRTKGYVGQWFSPDTDELRVYIMRGFHLLEYVVCFQSSTPTTKTEVEK